jgi:hypothetical protein
MGSWQGLAGPIERMRQAGRSTRPVRKVPGARLAHPRNSLECAIAPPGGAAGQGDLTRPPLDAWCNALEQRCEINLLPMSPRCRSRLVVCASWNSRTGNKSTCPRRVPAHVAVITISVTRGRRGPRRQRSEPAGTSSSVRHGAMRTASPIPGLGSATRGELSTYPIVTWSQQAHVAQPGVVCPAVGTERETAPPGRATEWGGLLLGGSSQHCGVGGLEIDQCRRGRTRRSVRPSPLRAGGRPMSCTCRSFTVRFRFR